MDIRHLIDLLPPIFKAQDTYRVNGKGFLERYLEICGNYLTDIITPDIDNILDIIQIDTTPKEYLNYLWEFLGEMPFANIYNVDKGKWDLNYDGTNMNEGIWLIDNNKPIALNDQTARDLIKYSLSLYKIRGTKKFFDTILRLYGMECTITHEDPDYDVVTPYFDTSHVDKDSLDIDYECKQCSNIRISLDDRYHELVFADINGVIVMGSDEKILTGKSLYLLPNYVAEPTKLDFITILTGEDTTRYEVIDTVENSSLEVGPLSGDIVYAEDYGVFGCTNKENTILYIGKWEHISGLSSADYHNYDHPTIFTDLRDGAAQYMWDDNWDLVKYDGSYSTNVRFFNLKDLVIAYNNYEGNIDFSNLSILPSDVRMFVSLRRLFESFFDRFTPYNANITLEYDGIAPDDNIEFNVLYEDPDNSIITNDHPTVNLKLVTKGKWPVFDNRYQVSRNGSEWNGPYHNEPIYMVSSPGTYYFRMLSSNLIIPVSVGTSMIQKQYSLNILEGNILYLTDFEGGTVTITPIAKLGDIPVGVTVEFPNGDRYNYQSTHQIHISESGQYTIYITNNQGIYSKVYVYDKPYSLTSLVDIPYGIKVTYKNSLGGVGTIGGPDSNIVPVIVCTSSYEITNIEPWLRDPKDPSKILYGSQFITDPEHVICFLNRKSTEDRYYQIDKDGSLVPKPVSISTAKELLNGMIELSSYNLSAILTLAQVNITPYYDPYSVDQSSQQTRFNYLHNPIVINTVPELSEDYIEYRPAINKDRIALSNGAGTTEDVFILGAILFDNRYAISNFYIWDSNSPYKGFRSPYYTATLQLSGTVQEVDLSGTKFKTSNGNTIRRQVVVLGRTNLNLVNTVSIFISDTNDKNPGLYIKGIGEDITNWSEEILASPLTITRNDGSTSDVSKIYTVKLDNSKVGKQVARFKLQVVFGGVYYDDISEGGIVVDDKGNPYNLRTTYIGDIVRYYIPRDDGSPLVLGNHGHIFSVKSIDSPDFTVMLNILIDEEAPDKLDIKFSMNPEVFHLPANGKVAITNMIASRPYKFEPSSNGVFIFGPLEDETENNEEDLVRSQTYEYTTKNIGSHTFSSEGVVDPLSVLAGTLEYPESSEKVFTVYKNK